MNFDFATATRIVFGPGTHQNAVELCRPLGSHPLVVTGKNWQRADSLLQAFHDDNGHPVVFTVDREPDIALVEEGTRLASVEKCDYIVAIGGGSVIDCGKAIAAHLTNSAPLLTYLEVVGQGEPLQNDPAPFVAIPTTAGTGAEVTRNAVLLAPEQRVKVSLRHAQMLPTIAIVDPQLTLGLPATLTASTGLDALTQLIEPFVSCRANAITDLFCRDGLPRIARSLRQAVSHGDDLDARTDMAMASLLGGLALANAGLGAVHGFAGPMGGRYRRAHGDLCAALLPSTMTVNLRALRTRKPDGAAVDRFREASILLSGDERATPESGVEWVRRLCVDLKVPTLSDLDVDKNDFTEIIAAAKRASSMKGNPLPLTDDELREILGLSFE